MSRMAAAILVLIASLSAALAQQEIALPSHIGGLKLLSFQEAIARDPKSPMLFKLGENESPIELGRGFSSLTGDLRGECVVGGPPPPPSFRFKTDYDILWIKSAEDFKKVTNLTGAASFGFGLWKTDAASQYYRSASQTKNSDYLYVRVKVEGPKYDLVRPDFDKSSKARQLINSKQWDQFRKLCGNYFIESVRVGGEFGAIYSFEHESEEERTDIQVQLRIAARGYGDGKVEFAQAMQRLSQYSRLRVKIVRSATGETVPENSIPALIEYARNFPTKVNKDTAWPIEIVRRDYQTIEPTIPVYREEEALIDKWAGYLGIANGDLADLDFALRNPTSLYPSMSDSSIEALTRIGRSYIDNLQAAARACADEPNSCRTLSDSIKEPNLSIPRRAQVRPIESRSGAEQLIGVVGPEETRRVVIIGQWSAWNNGEHLWWPPETCCFEVVIVSENGAREVKSYNPANRDHTVRGPARVYVRVGDGPDTYGDNRGRGYDEFQQRRGGPPCKDAGGCLAGIIY